MCVCLKNTLVTCAMFAPVCVCTNAYYIYVYMTNIIYMVILFFSFLIASIPLSARGPTHTHTLFSILCSFFPLYISFPFPNIFSFLFTCSPHPGFCVRIFHLRFLLFRFLLLSSIYSFFPLSFSLFPHTVHTLLLFSYRHTTIYFLQAFVNAKWGNFPKGGHIRLSPSLGLQNSLSLSLFPPYFLLLSLTKDVFFFAFLSETVNRMRVRLSSGFSHSD